MRFGKIMLWLFFWGSETVLWLLRSFVPVPSLSPPSHSPTALRRCVLPSTVARTALPCWTSSMPSSQGRSIWISTHGLLNLEDKCTHTHTQEGSRFHSPQDKGTVYSPQKTVSRGGEVCQRSCSMVGTCITLCTCLCAYMCLQCTCTRSMFQNVHHSIEHCAH